MTTRIARTAALILLVYGVGTAHAQDDPRVGLTMGYPTSVGVLWHISGRVAIRPEIDFFRSTLTTEGTGPLGPVSSKLTSRGIRPGVSALIYVNRVDQLRTYVSPRFTFTSSDSSDSNQPESSTWLASGSVGAQHQLGSRFAVFGELGLEYSRFKTEFSVLPGLSTTTRTSRIGTRSGVGVVLYF